MKRKGWIRQARARKEKPPCHLFRAALGICCQCLELTLQVRDKLRLCHQRFVQHLSPCFGLLFSGTPASLRRLAKRRGLKAGTASVFI